MVSNMASCIQATITPIIKPMGVAITNIPQRLVFAASVISDHLQLGVQRVGGRLYVRASAKINHLQVKCGVVCSLVDAYLRVESERIWLTQENDFRQDVVVYSNVKWIIE